MANAGMKLDKRGERLTDRAVRALKPRDKAYLVPDGRGLFLKIQPGGSRSWLARYQIARKVHDLGLGSYPETTLAMAREKALMARRQKANGVDPLIARRAEKRSGVTFRQAAERYISENRHGWKNAVHAAQWPATLEAYAYPEIGELPVGAIDTAAVLRCISPLWSAKAETASRLRGRIERVIDAARVAGDIPDGTPNPARWRGHLEHMLPKPSRAKAAARRSNGRGEHHAAMPYGELPAFMAALRERDGLAAKALEFTILTVARTGEAIGATWAEIDLEARLWCIPGERMKAGREHRVPLSEAAASLLAALPGERSGKVFAVSNMALLMLLRRMGRGDLTTHGFRSTFSDWTAEQTNTPSEVREMAMAHAVGNKVEAAYRRSDLFTKRRQLAEAWAKFCGGEAGGKVVPLRAAIA